MKQINFISSVSQKTKKEVRRWIIISMLITVVTALFIAGSIFFHCYHYYLLRQERMQAMKDHSHCTLILQTRKEKDAHTATRTNQLTRLQRYQNQPAQLASHLRACNDIIGAGAMQSCTMTKKMIELVYASPTISHAQNILRKLQTVPSISNVQLISLQRQHNGVTNTVRAEVSC